MAKADLLVSVLAILRDDAPILRAFVGEVTQVLEANYSNFEILLVDNGSGDYSAGDLQRLLAEYRCVRFLRLSRQMEDETATLAGLDAAIGDFVVVMDADSDPPAEIVPMIERCRAGSDVVIGVDTERRSSGVLYRLLRQFFFVSTRWLVGIEWVHGATGFRALSRHAVNALTRVRQRRRHFAWLVSDIGFAAALHPFRSISRSGGRLQTHLTWAVRRGLSIVVHNSIKPLRLVSVLGMLGSLFSLLYSVYAVIVYLIKQDVAQGWTTLSLQTSAMFFVVFLMLTLLGEYLGRILEESSDRPLYHVREEQASAVMLSDLTRRNVLDRSEEEPLAAAPKETR